MSNSFAFLAQLDEPSTIEKALTSLQVDKWQQAFDSKYDSLVKNWTWTSMDLLSNQSTINYKWILRKKIQCWLFNRVVQGKTSYPWFFSSWRNRLPWNVFYCCKNDFITNYFIFGCKFGYWPPLDGCKNNFPKWIFVGGNIYELAKRLL